MKSQHRRVQIFSGVRMSSTQEHLDDPFFRDYVVESVLNVEVFIFSDAYEDLPRTELSTATADSGHVRRR